MKKWDDKKEGNIYNAVSVYFENKENEQLFVKTLAKLITKQKIKT